MTTTQPPDDWDDAAPMTSEERSRGHLAYIARKARKATGLSQEAFSKAYGIPLGTFRDWEQGRRQSDPATLAYLRVITEMPEAVAKVIAV